MTIKAFVKQHPILTYYALAFAISWGAILILVGPGGFLATTSTSPLFALVGFTSLLGPSVAGILMTALTPRGHAPIPVQPARVTPTDPGRAAAGDGHEQGEPRGRCQPIT